MTSSRYAIDHPAEASYVSNSAVAELFANRVNEKLNRIAFNLFVPAVNPMLELIPP